MRAAFKALTSLLFVAVVAQVGFAGYGAFNAIDKADKGKTVTKKTIENGFDPHGIAGTVVLALLQWLFAYLGTKSAPVGGFLHGINALAIYAAAALLAHRAWTQKT